MITTLLSGLFGLLGIIIAYYVGRRSKVDEVKIRHGYELAERIASLFEDVHELYLAERRLYDINFGHLDGPSEAADYFLRSEILSHEEQQRIDELRKKKDELAQLTKKAGVYIRPAILDWIREYLKACEFVYETDGGLFINTYIENFFRNLTDDSAHAQREKLHKRFQASLRKLAP